MRLLLDTHVIIWAAILPERLSQRARDAIVEADERLVSVASAWEYEAKRARSPGSLPRPFDDLMSPEFTTLDVRFGIHNRFSRLPSIHSDPFDRMLIAQAMEADLAIVTADANIRRYPVETIW